MKFSEQTFGLFCLLVSIPEGSALDSGNNDGMITQNDNIDGVYYSLDAHPRNSASIRSEDPEEFMDTDSFNQWYGEDPNDNSEEKLEIAAVKEELKIKMDALKEEEAIEMKAIIDEKKIKLELMNEMKMDELVPTLDATRSVGRHAPATMPHYAPITTTDPIYYAPTTTSVYPSYDPHYAPITTSAPTYDDEESFAQIGEFPFFVRFGAYCSGSLIAPNLVLTTAHCSRGQGEVARIGGGVESDGIEAVVAEQILHPDRDADNYDDDNYEDDYDYAIIELDRDIDTVKYSPINLNFDSSKPIVHDKLTVLGFDHSIDYDDIYRLKKVDIYVDNEATCFDNEEQGVALGAGYICATIGDGFDDSGGPVIQENNGVFTQVGIDVNGDGTLIQGGLYARLSLVSSWLKSEICSRSSEPKPLYCETPEIRPEGEVLVFGNCNYKGGAVKLLPGRYDVSRLDDLGIENNDLSSIYIPEGLKVKIYEHGNFNGSSKTLHSSVDCLKNIGFNDKISSMIVKVEKVEVFKYCGLKGESVELLPGRYNKSQLADLGVRNNALSSISVPEGFEVKIYDHDDFGGSSRTLRSNVDCLKSIGFNDRISSMIVSFNVNRDKVKVYKHCGFRDKAVELIPGYYNASQLSDLGLKNNNLSSIFIPEEYEVTIYEHDEFEGSSKTLRSSALCLVDTGLNDEISSIIVRIQIQE